MPNATYRVHILARGGTQSAVGYAAYGSGKKLKQSSASKTLPIGSVVGAAAYRSGQPLRDHEKDTTFDYSGREDVVYESVLAPDHAPLWAYDRESLWNEVENREGRKNARLARSIVVGLPRELDMEENIRLLREHAQHMFVARGMVVDIAIHDKDASDGGRNPHAHLLLTVREFDAQGNWAKTKNRAWDGWESNEQRKQREAEGKPNLMQQWREDWEQRQNAYLEEAGDDARISMKSYAEQGINRTPQFHHGVAVNEKKKRGEEPYVEKWNQEIGQENLMRGVMDAATPIHSTQENRDEELETVFTLLPVDAINHMQAALLDQEHRLDIERGMDE